MPRLRLPIHIRVRVAPDMLHQLRHNRIPAPLRIHKMLPGLKLQQHILLIVMHKLHAARLQILRRALRLLAQLLAVLLVSLTLADGLHLVLPVRVEGEVLVEAQVRHRPARGAAALVGLARLDERDAAALALGFARLEEVEGRHRAGEAGADDDEVVFRGRHSQLVDRSTEAG